MDAKDIYNLQEAYLGVYIQEEVDSWIDELIEEGYDVDDYTDEELLEAFLDERKNEDPKGVANRAGVNKPDAWGAPTEFGKEAKRGSLAHGMSGVRTLQRAGVRINRHHRQNYLAHKVHQGWASAAENSPHQTPEQKTRRAKLINRDLGSFRKNLSKKERKKDVPFVKQAERAVNKQGEFAREQVDIYDIILSHLLDEGYADSVKNAEVIMVNMSEEWRDSIVEVKGFGGHVDPNTGKSSGLRSPSQQSHTTHWRNRQQGKDVPDVRRSKFKYGGAKGSTTGAHQGEPPEYFAKNQDPQLAMTPSARMASRARALKLRGQTKRANKIRAVMNRPNM